MRALLLSLLDGLRLVLLRAPRGRAIATGPGTFFAAGALYFAVASGIAACTLHAPLDLDAYGLANTLAEILLVLALGTLLVRLAQRDVTWGAAAILLAAAMIGLVLVRGPLTFAANAFDAHDHALLGTLVDLLPLLWWLLMLLVFANWLAPHHFVRMCWSALLAYGAFAFAWMSLPTNLPLGPSHAAMLAAAGTQDDADGNAPDDDAAPAETPAFDAEKLMYDQPALLEAALAKLKPQTPGKVDLYVVAFAGDAQEDVFRNEAEYVGQLFSERFDAAGHVLVLENNAATTATHPLANWTNLQRALDAVAKKMDPAEDVLLLYLTSHGSEDHQLLVDLEPLPLNQIGPVDLADALKTEPRIRWKVVVVNACYSGGFVDAVRDDSTMVIASARADRTSFGCGADSDVTYFGKAFLVDALNETASIREAFDRARQSVAEWEAKDGEERSEPQIATSAAIEAKLATWQRGLTPGAAVPFVPASPAAPASDREENP